MSSKLHKKWEDLFYIHHYGTSRDLLPKGCSNHFFLPDIIRIFSSTKRSRSELQFFFKDCSTLTLNVTQQEASSIIDRWKLARLEWRKE